MVKPKQPGKGDSILNKSYGNLRHWKNEKSASEKVEENRKAHEQLKEIETTRSKASEDAQISTLQAQY